MSEPEYTNEGSQELCKNCKGNCIVEIENGKTEPCGHCNGTGIEPSGE
mgnify:CR=1 FL=1